MKTNWQTKKLGEACSLIKGKKPERLSSNGSVAYLTAKVIRNSEAPMFAEKNDPSIVLVNKTNLVIIMDGSNSGEMFTRLEGALASTMGIVKCQKSQLDPTYTLHFLTTHREDFTKSRTGSAIPHLNKEQFENLEIPVPPLKEQKRIVKILDGVLGNIEKAKKNTEKNIQNVQELFESHLQYILADPSELWQTLRLSELLEKGWVTSHLDGNHGGNYPRKNEFIPSGVPYISANCLKDESVDFSFSKYLSPKRASLLHKGIAQNNDVLFAHNATVGPVAILQTTLSKVILSTSLTYYRCNPKYISPKYLAHYMRSSKFKSQYTSVMRQSTRNQVPITKQRELYHVIPPIKDQRRIAVKLDKLSEQTRKLKENYQKKLENLEELRKSVLAKAFRGEL